MTLDGDVPTRLSHLHKCVQEKNVTRPSKNGSIDDKSTDLI